ncbi:hypothetical protein AB0F72_14370 [Actinoplanes sp. NPDC023936]|uniref:hypothetical protein n=1 Tax=Actinoplanes sp. NPDC023936 TaxID=3154910 RepID=UPI0033EBC881
MRYEQVPLPAAEGGVAPAGIAAAVTRWSTSTPLRDLVESFGGRIPRASGTGAVLAYLDDFSAQHWDYRRGRERIDADEPVLAADLVRRVTAATAALGLCDRRPPRRRRYTHLLMLGAVAPACLQRVHYAGHLISAGTTAAGVVTGLGSYRRLHEAERAALAPLGLHGCAYEVDVLTAAVRDAFALGEPDKVVEELHTGPDLNRSWSSRWWHGPGPEVRVLASASSAPGARRASTLDTLRHWAREVALTLYDRVLIVTSGIYVPYQHCDAVRILALSSGCAVETVGLDPAAVPRTLPAVAYTPGNHLQELRSTICSMRRLYEAVT